MSSEEFETIFEHASALVRIRCKGIAGLDMVLSSLKNRVTSGIRDPRLDRGLFFEPWLDSQQLGIPQSSAEEIARELHQLSVLTVWSRVRCPEVFPDEDGTIIETSSSDELAQAQLDQCPHCGTCHELIPSIVETLYAPNFPISDVVAPFEARRLNLSNGTLRQKEDMLDAQTLRCLAITRSSALKGTSFALLLRETLATNSALESVPDPRHAWAATWKGPIIIILAYFALCSPIAYFAGQVMGWICGAVAVFVIWLVIRGDTQTKLAPSAACRQVTRWGMMSSVLLLTAGTTGFQFSLTEENRLSIPLTNGHKINLPIKFEYGSANYWLVGLGVFLFVITGIFVLVYDKRIGWFTR